MGGVSGPTATITILRDVTVLKIQFAENEVVNRMTKAINKTI